MLCIGAIAAYELWAIAVHDQIGSKAHPSRHAAVLCYAYAMSLLLWIPGYNITDVRVRYLMATSAGNGEHRPRLFTQQDMRNPCIVLCKLLVIAVLLPCTMHHVPFLFQVGSIWP